MTFSVLAGKEVEGRSGTILEGESGFNDPVGIALMIGMIELAVHPSAGIADVAWEFLREMGIGLAVGAIAGVVMLQALRRVPLPDGSLYPLAVIALATVPLLMRASRRRAGCAASGGRGRRRRSAGRWRSCCSSAPDRQTLADRALDWAMRLMGAESGMLLSADGVPLAVQELGPYQAADLIREVAPASTSQLLAIPGEHGRLAMIASLPSPPAGESWSSWQVPSHPSSVRMRWRGSSSTLAPSRPRSTGPPLIEQLRELNGELERANRHKSDFLANMSHECGLR